jgi:hypothetical protein
MHMKLTFTRSPYEEHHPLAEKDFDGSISRCISNSFQGAGYLQISFSTNPDGQKRSTFSAPIGPKQFEELARLMVEADPQAAIRAFGSAMKDIEIQKRETDTSEVVAA